MATSAEDLIRYHQFTVGEYRRMGETGILHEDDRVELIAGEIIEMSPIGSTHSGTITRLQTLLMRAVVDQGIVSIQNPLILGDLSEPQPDIALLHPRSDFYTGSHPTPEDVILLIEVADSSLDYDRRIKLPLYARHRIPAVWLVDLRNEQLLLYSGPTENRYQTMETADIRYPIGLPGFPDCNLDLTGLF